MENSHQKDSKIKYRGPRVQSLVGELRCQKLLGGGGKGREWGGEDGIRINSHHWGKLLEKPWGFYVTPCGNMAFGHQNRGTEAKERKRALNHVNIYY